MLPSSPQDAVHPCTASPVAEESEPSVAVQLARFTGIGVVMTLAYLTLYVALRGTLGEQCANVVAWVVTAIVDTAANRRLAFGVCGRSGAARAQVQGLVVFGIGMVLTSGSLFTLDAMVTHPTQPLELGVLIVANLLAGILRFSLLRHWVFASRRLNGAVQDLRTGHLDRDLSYAANLQPASPQSVKLQIARAPLWS